MVYLRDKQLSPSEVIAGELSRINPLLNINCLELLQNDVSEVRAMAASSDLKKRVVDRSKALSDQLKNLVVTLGLALLLPFFVGCGLKADPKNDATELRPDVPFKSASQTPPEYIIISPDKNATGKNLPDPKRGTNGNKGK
jgi:hypothetical protein